MRRAVALWAAALAGCGAGASAGPDPIQPVARCPADQAPANGSCVELGADRADLDRGARELSEFRAEEAVKLLERARSHGPYRYRDYTRVFEQLGVAYAYLGLEEKALKAFDMLLSLAPSYALPYTLSPRATFVFERARKAAHERPPPRVRVTWPRDLRIDRPVPVEVEVVSDPKTFLERARLFARREGKGGYEHFDLDLKRPGDYQRLLLPPVAPRAESGGLLDLYLIAYDARGNEVLRWRSPDQPAELPLAYRPPTPWYRKWWIWAIGVGVGVAATGAGVYAITRSPPDEVGGGVSVGRLISR